MRVADVKLGEEYSTALGVGRALRREKSGVTFLMLNGRDRGRELTLTGVQINCTRAESDLLAEQTRRWQQDAVQLTARLGPQHVEVLWPCAHDADPRFELKLTPAALRRVMHALDQLPDGGLEVAVSKLKL